MLSQQEKSIIHVRKNTKHVRKHLIDVLFCKENNILYMCASSMFSRMKAHLCVKEPCIPMTATDCNRKKAHLCVKEPCIPMRKSPTLAPTTSLQQTATERAL